MKHNNTSKYISEYSFLPNHTESCLQNFHLFFLVTLDVQQILFQVFKYGD